MRFGYARVSTREQETHLQTDALLAAGCERIFEETASGAQRDRPQLTLALSHLRSGDVLVVWRLDRLARSVRQLVETVEDLSARGIGFVSLNEEINTTTSGGRLVFHLFSALAQFERDLIRDRTNAGLEAAKKRGAKFGRPKSLSQQQIEMGRALKAAGKHSASEIAAQLNISRATLYRSL